MGESDNNGKVSMEEEEEEQPLSPAARLFHSPSFNCYIIAILGCNTKFKPDVIKSGLEQTLLKHPRFSSKLVRETILFFSTSFVEVSLAFLLAWLVLSFCSKWCFFSFLFSFFMMEVVLFFFFFFWLFKLQSFKLMVCLNSLNYLSFWSNTFETTCAAKCLF